MSSTGWTITSCSKPPPHSDAGVSAASTRGRRKASRPAASFKLTSCSSNEGIRPSERAEIRPMRTGTPSTLLASISMRGRNSSIRGTIQPCSKPQVAPNSNQKASNSQSAKRAARASHLKRGNSGVGAGDRDGFIGFVIMTACIALGDTKGVVTVRPAIRPVPGGLMQGVGPVVWCATPARSKAAMRWLCAKLRASRLSWRQCLSINLSSHLPRMKACDCL